MARYLMNAAVIPHGCPGTYTYHLATVEALIAFVLAGEVLNTIVYPDTLKWVKEVTGRRFKLPAEGTPANSLQPGDEAFVIRRVTRRARRNAGMQADVISHALITCASRNASMISSCRNAGARSSG